jgi:putative hemolysin
MHLPQIARDITYSHSARSRPGRLVIRAVENLTGRIQLIKRAEGYDRAVAEGDDFWRVMMQRYGLHLDVIRGSLEDIPQTGPLVVIANHPYGVLDGLVMGYILSGLRGDFRILAHSVFRKAPDLQRVILPMDFSDTPEAQRANIDMRAEATRYLQAGGAIGIFPGGTVSTAARPFGQPLDPVWRRFTARLIQRSGATVVPIWFDGQNSRLFQVASHLNYTLRMALLLREFKARTDGPVRLAVGRPIGPDQLADFRGDGKEMMDFLRRSTYDLSPGKAGVDRFGFEFEAQHKR